MADALGARGMETASENGAEKTLEAHHAQADLADDAFEHPALALGNLYATQNPAFGMHASEFQQMVYDLLCLRDDAVHVNIDLPQLCANMRAQFSPGIDDTSTVWLSCADFLTLAQHWQQVQEGPAVARALSGGLLRSLNSPDLIQDIYRLHDRRRSAAANRQPFARAITVVAAEQEEALRDFTETFTKSVAVLHASTTRMYLVATR